MLMICSKVIISNSPEGLQHLLDVIYKHAQEWKLKVNTKKPISSYLAVMELWLLSLCKGNS